MENKVEKVWGSEEWIINTDKYCGKILNLNEGFRCSMHHHKQKDETFYILEGEVLLEHDGKMKILKTGDSQRILPGQKHRFTGLKKSRIIEFSTHHDDFDSYREEGKLSGKVNLEMLKNQIKSGEINK